MKKGWQDSILPPYVKLKTYSFPTDDEWAEKLMTPTLLIAHYQPSPAPGVPDVATTVVTSE
ncbi:MAG: hypothetical protein JXM79_07210 [Sedimentisphaerales bacterium]|nr:hypothetical protein [Sedimentisphaerales bacterium]